MLRTLPRAALARRSVRSVSYILPSIPLLDNLRVGNKGLDGLYSQKQVGELWFERGQSLVNGLNQLLEDNKVTNAPSDLNELITLTFNKPELYGIYSYALMLHNLQFCMETLKPNDSTGAASLVSKKGESALLETPSIATTFSNEPKETALREWIQDSFGLIAEFRTLLLNSAQGIKGDGVTWLVAQATYSESTLKTGNSDVSFNKLAVMNTYNAGIVDDSIRLGQVTKLKQQKQAKLEAVKRRQQERSEIEGTVVEETEPVKENDLVLGTLEEAEEALLFSDRKLLPLLAIDASMRAYLPDYGVFGKQQYLSNVWDCIDWDVVSRRAPHRFKPSVVFEN